MEDTLRRQAECFLGAEIQPSEWDKAVDQAERKLERIIEREGDCGGKRRRMEYLAQLIAEAVKSSRFSRFTIDLMTLDRYTDEQMGTKKEQPV